MVRQRVYQIAAGYEDCNDADFLRIDPASGWRPAPGAPLSGGAGLGCLSSRALRCFGRKGGTPKFRKIYYIRGLWVVNFSKFMVFCFPRCNSAANTKRSRVNLGERGHVTGFLTAGPQAAAQSQFR